MTVIDFSFTGIAHGCEQGNVILIAVFASDDEIEVAGKSSRSV
jgi:hypothetical protein